MILLFFLQLPSRVMLIIVLLSPISNSKFTISLWTSRISKIYVQRSHMGSSNNIWLASLSASYLQLQNKYLSLFSIPPMSLKSDSFLLFHIDVILEDFLLQIFSSFLFILTCIYNFSDSIPARKIWFALSHPLGVHPGNSRAPENLLHYHLFQKRGDCLKFQHVFGEAIFVTYLISVIGELNKDL